MPSSSKNPPSGGRVDFFEAVVPRDMFQRIQKRDGRVVDFDKSKITQAIWRAAQSVDGKNKQLSDVLADRVIIYLSSIYDDHLLTIEEVQDAVEKVLIENSHARTSKAFILYRQDRRQKRMQRAKYESGGGTAQDMEIPSLRIRTSGDEVVRWDRRRITDALVRETGLPRAAAERIAVDVERQVIHSKVETITAGLVRELVNAKLVELGFEQERRMHTRLGVPLFDAERILTRPGWGRDSVLTNTPQSSEAALSDAITRQFALARVFPEIVNEAHLEGELHISGLGGITRPYSMWQTPEYLKKFGLSLPGALASARPARRAKTLIGHILKVTEALDAHLCQTISWEGFNVFLAPLLDGLSKTEVLDLAESILYEFSQQGSAQDGSPINCELHLYPSVPAHLRGITALGAGGEELDSVYSDWEEKSVQLLEAMLQVLEKGDAAGRPFISPCILLHIGEGDMEKPATADILKLAARVAESKGSPAFVYDRKGEIYVGDGGRLRFTPSGPLANEAAHPWKLRGAALQLVSINLARAAFRSGGDEEALYNRVSDLLTLALKAHIAKRDFLSLLIAKGEVGPLTYLAAARDGEPYLRLDRCVGLIGLVGLDALCRAHWGCMLQEDLGEDNSRARALLEFMSNRCREISDTFDIPLILHQPAGGNAAVRLARMDLEHFPVQTASVAGGLPDEGLVYYTTGAQTRGFMDPLRQLRLEGSLHQHMRGKCWTLIRPQGNAPDLFELLRHAEYETRCTQLAWTPEFTTCRDCHQIKTSLSTVCPQCGSSNVEQLTRVTDAYAPLAQRSAAWCEAIERGSIPR
jgi:ribonucleoside-triphosphate reductase (formate)